MRTPLQRHNEESKRKREELQKSWEKLQLLANVELPGDLITYLSTAYKDLQTSLNNTDAALLTARSLLSSSLSQANQSQTFQPNPDQQKNQDSKLQDHTSRDFQTRTNPYPLPSLESLIRKLKSLESRQIFLVKRQRKLFRFLGFKQAFVDSLEGRVSIYSQDESPEIDPSKNIVGEQLIG